MTRMQTYALSLGAALLLATLAPAHAQNLKIGYVNVPYLLQNAPQTQAVDQQLRAEFAPRQAELQEMQDDLKAKSDRLERDAAVMGQEERAALQREIDQGSREYQRLGQALQDDANIRQQELVDDLQNSVGRLVQAYAKDKGYDLIVSNVVYASDAIDITEDVLAAIKKDADD